MKARTLLRNGTARLKDSPAIDHWQKGREKIEAEILLIDLMGEEPDPDDKISPKKQRTFEEWIERRYTGEPVAHITGTTDFMGLDLIVEPGVFVPRDSSEWLAMQAIKRLRKRKKPVHVDLASGMGTIALAVSSEVPKAEVFGAELSTEGVKLARRNARKYGLSAKFGAGDLFDPVPKRLRGDKGEGERDKKKGKDPTPAAPAFLAPPRGWLARSGTRKELHRPMLNR